MAFVYEGKIVLIDEQGIKTTLTYDMGTTVGADVAAEFGPVFSELEAIATALAAVTTANLFEVGMYFRDDTNETQSLPAEAEVPEEAAISVHLVAEPDAAKLGQLRIPAPVDGIFLADGVTVDTGNALVQAYVAAVAAAATISDGETIVTARGDGGLEKGHLRFKARSGRRI